jgi:heat shock protein HslJ
MDGQVTGRGSCNTYGGTYQVEGNSISFKDITRTKKACENEYLTLQEEYYFMALESAGHYELNENTLRIWYEDGAGLLVFQTPSPIEPTPAIQTPGG